MRVPVWVCVRGVGVVVDCLIVRVDDDCVVVSPVWGRGGVPGLRGRVCGPVLGCLQFCFVFCGEFDPGSGRTLAACLTHASRTMKRCPFGGGVD